MPRPAHTPDTLTLRLSGMQADQDGLCGLYWPIPPEEAERMRRTVHARLAGVTQSALRAGTPGATELAVLLYPLLMETLGLLQAQLLIARSRDAGARIDADPGHRYLPALLRDQAPPPLPLLKALGAGFPGRSPKKVLDNIFRLFRPKPKPRPTGDSATRHESLLADQDAPAKVIHHGRVTGSLLREGIVSTKRDAPGELISRHAAGLDEPVVLAKRRFWFPPLDAPGRDPLGPGLRQEWLDATQAVFQDFDAPLPNHLSAHLEALLDQGAALVGGHLARLRRRPERLPRRLWTGTCGNIWDCMLRYAVREAGGHVTGHDHAWGPRYTIVPRTIANELRACDTFFAYNEAQADMIRTLADDPACLLEPMPEIATLPPERAMAWAAWSMEHEPNDALPKRIMVPGSLFLGDQPRLTHLPPDPVAVDFLIRLFRTLVSWGHEVVYKPHPESTFQADDLLGSLDGVRVEHGTFEAVLDQADLVLHQTATSTVFTSTMLTDMPAVLIDLGLCPWTPETLDLLQKRCPVVPAAPGPDGRIDLDWDRLGSALAQAPKQRRDASFRTRFFS